MQEETSLTLSAEPANEKNNARLSLSLKLALLALWAALVLFRFFEEHPFKLSFLMRLLQRFRIPLEVNSEQLLSLAQHLGLALLLSGVGILAGRRLLRLLGIRINQAPSGAEFVQHLLLSLGLGWGLLMYVVLLLGAVGKLYPQAIWLLTLSLLLISFPEARALSHELHALPKQRIPGRDGDCPKNYGPCILGRRFGTVPKALIESFGLVAFAIVALSVLIIALAPSITHDAMVYHLNVPRIYANSRKIVPIPYNLFSNTVLNVEMLYALALSLDDFILANLLHLSMGLAALAALYSFAQPIVGSRAARLAVFILFFNPLVLNEISIAYVDLAMMFYFLLMMACLWKWKSENNTRWFLLFCIYSGIFAGIKYTALHGLVAAGAVIAVIELGLQRSIPGFMKRGALWGIIVTAFVLPYLIKNCLFSGNPVYPLMYDIFGGKWLTPGQVERMLAYVASHGMGHDWKHLALLPWNITILGQSGFHHFDAVITPLWLAFLPALLLVRLRPILKWSVFVCAVYFISWSASTHITRYLMPIFPLLSLLCAQAILALKDKGSSISTSLGKVVAAALVLVCAFTWFSFSYYYPLRAPREFGPVIWGNQSRDEFLAEKVPAYSAFKYINESLPETARFAFLWDNRGFFCDREQIGDSVFEAPSMLEMVHEAGSADAFHKKLRSMGIDFLLFNELYSTKFPPFARSAEDRARLKEDNRILKEFLKGYCWPLFKADGATIYAVHL